MAFFIFGDYFSVTWTLAFGAILLFLVYDWWCHQYFQRAGIPVAPYYPILGNGHQWLTTGNINFAEECVQKYGKVVGIYKFRDPILIVTDIDIVKKVLVTDFNKFPNHWDIPAAGFPLEDTLLYMKGHRWKEARAIITPSFTTSKLKNMVETLNDGCDPLLGNFEKAYAENRPLDCKRVYLGFFIQTTLAILYGLDVQSQTNLDHPFIKKVEKAFQPSLITVIPILFPVLGPLFSFFGANIFSRDAIKFFKKIITDSVAGADMNMGERSGKYITLRELYVKNTELPGQETPKDSEERAKKLTYKEFVSAGVLLLAGGNEATSTFLNCTTYQLALSPEVQDKLIAEIDQIAPNREDITYETMAKMVYMETVIMESFRMYPPTLLADRVCLQTVKYGNYTIKKGVLVNIPFYPIQHDPDVWPDPEKFDPDRFSPENKEHNNPMGWVVFGAGPRICIAVKFVTLLAKIFLTRVLQKYRFEKCPETPNPLKFRKMTMLEPGDVYVRVVPRKDR